MVADELPRAHDRSRLAYILPFTGEIDPSRYSLLALTAVMGLADEFNPCAMWVSGLSHLPGCGAGGSGKDLVAGRHLRGHLGPSSISF